MSSSEHWLDRLAAPQTRRQGLRLALGAAATTLPLFRSVPLARADDSSCVRACLLTQDKNFVERRAVCRDSTVQGFALACYAPVLMAGPLGGAGAAIARGVACVDLATLHKKAADFDCLKPNCGGYDPRGHNGPCQTCAAQCCPDSTIPSGYSCCDICSQSGDGCCYSVTGVC
jgi:hypothetical protein